MPIVDLARPATPIPATNRLAFAAPALLRSCINRLLSPYFLLRFATLFLLLALAHGAFAAPAQTAPPATDKDSAASYAALADLLENETTRKRLIDELRTLAEPAKTQQATADVKPAPKPTESSIEEEPFLFSRGIANGIEHFITGLGADLSEAATVFRSLGEDDDTAVLNRSKWRDALLNFAIVVIATMIAFFVFRRLAGRFFARSNDWITATGNESDSKPGTGRLAQSGLYRKTIAIVAAMVADAGAILLAGAAGYATALFAVGNKEHIDTLASLFINTFVAVEIAKALVRGVFAPRYKRLRLFEMDDDVAVFWGHWLERLVGLTGYGILVGVPLAKSVLSPTIGHILGVLIILGVYLYAVRVIWHNRHAVRERMERYADGLSAAFFSTLTRMLARIWHIPAIAYFTALLVVSQIAPNDALPFMAEATLQTLAAIGIGLLASAIVTAALSRRIVLSHHLRERLPLLEPRINAYVPPALKGFHVLTMLVVALVVLDAWHAFNLANWIASDNGRSVILAVVHVAIILLIATVVWTTVASIIEHRLSPTPGQGQPSEREKTLLALFRNAALIAIVTLTILVVLSQIGIDIAPLIAGAGVAGLAIGFGAQKLVQDVITGVFIQLENGMNQNDVVEVAGIFGTVEKITIRSVGIRTLDGGFHMIPFSSVDKVSNHTRDFSYHYGEYAVPYRENVDEAMTQLRNAFAELMQDAEMEKAVMADIEIPGVTSLHERGYNIRVLIKTLPGMQWPVQRAFNRLVKKHFDAAGIALPYPHTVLRFGDDNDTLPAFPLRSAPENGA
ncbi:mechanosensitive ion channel domain-containing protein [Oxalicibacterium solurbis]|uniref:Mechanosensitive channel protein n=1 Tax=Oxalicibacterium solurbis TaxID=69280 RepID=A0A8J3AVD0_9BURK|nr:mechanosensitive ion channel domain-containing protein [Oxalicibacterium solurbis]GGI53935.1 mechanosensitive channel protein [Oxalicibacterium solurbis]